MSKLDAIHSGLVWGQELNLVPEKTYDLEFVSYSTQMMLGKNPKLVLLFRILNSGDFDDLVIPRYYGVIRLIGRPGNFGGFKVGKKSNFLREYLTLFPDQPVKRTDRVSMSRFSGVVIRGEVRTVKRGFNQRKIPGPLQYSVIDSLIKVKPRSK